MSESDVVIRVEGLGKKYALHHEKAERYTALRDVVARQARAAGRLLNPFTLAGQLRKAQREAAAERAESEVEFWALRDVSFEIRRGERVGIIGRNGAGKSTLLKILSRITEPTTGRVEIRGRVASLLEVGTGFHPELTGRENIYLNGAILGMTRREIRSKFDEIVDFAEVEKFLDTPVKRYSSGMYVRLAFAVAAHLEPEILVVDEVLAVGDAEFQKKCIGKLDSDSQSGERTVLFVSHSMDIVQKLCPSTLLLKNGSVVAAGSTREVIKDYLLPPEISCHYIDKSQTQAEAKLEKAQILVNGKPSIYYENTDNMTLDLLISSATDCHLSVEVLLKNQIGSPLLFWPSGFMGDYMLTFVKESRKELSVIISLPALAKGKYYFDIMLAVPGKRFIQYLDNCLSFEVKRFDCKNGSYEFVQSSEQGSMLMQASISEKPA